VSSSGFGSENEFDCELYELLIFLLKATEAIAFQVIKTIIRK